MEWLNETVTVRNHFSLAASYIDLLNYRKRFHCFWTRAKCRIHSYVMQLWHMWLMDIKLKAWINANKIRTLFDDQTYIRIQGDRSIASSLTMKELIHVFCASGRYIFICLRTQIFFICIQVYSTPVFSLVGNFLIFRNFTKKERKVMKLFFLEFIQYGILHLKCCFTLEKSIPLKESVEL